MKEAGIEKHITYHSSRHTTATLAITAGADISAVKEMQGHGSVTSTEVYANWRTKQEQRWACSIYALQEEEDEVKVSLNKKIQAVRLIDGVFG